LDNWSHFENLLNCAITAKVISINNLSKIILIFSFRSAVTDGK
jgi:hypothetical protein